MRRCDELVWHRTHRSARCHKNYYDRRKHEFHYQSKDLVMVKTMAFQPFQRKFQDRYTGPWTVMESVFGNCYRIQLSEHEKPQIVHHDRLKPYQARNAEQHNTDWVDRVKARYASNKLPYLANTPSDQSMSLLTKLMLQQRQHHHVRAMHVINKLPQVKSWVLFRIRQRLRTSLLTFLLLLQKARKTLFIQVLPVICKNRQILIQRAIC